MQTPHQQLECSMFVDSLQGGIYEIQKIIWSFLESRSKWSRISRYLGSTWKRVKGGAVLEKLIYSIKVLDSLMSAYTSEEKAKEVLEERKEFYDDIESTIEPLMLILSEDDIKNIILDNLELSKKIIKEAAPDGNN